MKFNYKWVVALAATLLLAACGSDEEKSKKRSKRHPKMKELRIQLQMTGELK